MHRHTVSVKCLGVERGQLSLSTQFRRDGDYKTKTFPCSEQLRVMTFAQLTYWESLRDLEICLRAVKLKRYHMGIRSGISRNNLSYPSSAWRCME